MDRLITVYHGSKQIVEVPAFGLGRKNNDFGLGFYCTESIDLAKEWAVSSLNEGFASRYTLDTEYLNILNLNSPAYTILNWMAVLVDHRLFSIKTPVARRAKQYLIEHFGVNVNAYDLITGYRADDSYFRYAEAFVENTLPLRGLNRALRLGKLGLQTVLISPKAFSQIKFVDAAPVDKTIYYPKFVARDTQARRTYKEEIARSKSYRDDIFVLDILREEMKNDDPRIQRILLA